jgi:hypothetical protein
MGYPFLNGVLTIREWLYSCMDYNTFVAIFNFGGGRCSDEAHRLYFWLALDVGFGWPADSWQVQTSR